MFALQGSISKTQSPSELILNCKLDFNTHCKVEFSEYVQTHEEHDNSMATCTVSTIATQATGNTQGGYYFICLDTRRHINHCDWTSLPMPTEVIDQVHRLARCTKANKQITFTNIRNEDIDILYAGLPDDYDGPPDLYSEPAGVHGEPDDAYNSDYHPNEESDDSDDNSDSSSEPDNDTDNDNSTTASALDIKITGVDDNMGMDDNDPHEQTNDNYAAMGNWANADYSAETGGENIEEEGEAGYDPSTKIAGVDDDTNNDSV
jgi:hypothetical protein